MGKDFVQGINNNTIYAEKIYKTNFTKDSKKFVLSSHYNGDNSYFICEWKTRTKIQVNS